MRGAYSPNTTVSWIFLRVRAFSRYREVAHRRFATNSSGSRSKAVMVFTAEERGVDGGERGSRAEAPRGLRKVARNAPRRADSRCLEGNRRVNGNCQFINQIGVCENHRAGLEFCWVQKGTYIVYTQIQTQLRYPARSCTTLPGADFMRPSPVCEFRKVAPAADRRAPLVYASAQSERLGPLCRVRANEGRRRLGDPVFIDATKGNRRTRTGPAKLIRTEGRWSDRPQSRGGSGPGTPKPPRPPTRARPRYTWPGRWQSLRRARI